MTLFSYWPAALTLALIFWGILIHNSLVRARNRSTAAWSQIDVQLKRRHDLVPNLVRTVEGYLRHERETVEAVAQARRKALEAAGDLLRQAEAEGALSRSLHALAAVIEGYPQLRAVSAIRDLMEQLASAENRIAFARQHYNDLAADFNSRAGSFPGTLVARRFGFTPLPFFTGEKPPDGPATRLP